MLHILFSAWNFCIKLEPHQLTVILGLMSTTVFSGNLLPGKPGRDNNDIRMDDMNAGSWRRLGMHRATARGMRVLVCQGSQLRSWQRWRCPLLTCDPRMSLKKQDDPAWSQVQRLQLAALHHSADASRRPVHPRRAGCWGVFGLWPKCTLPKFWS